MKFNKKVTLRRPASIRFIQTITVLFLIFVPLILQTFAQEYKSEKEMALLREPPVGLDIKIRGLMEKLGKDKK